MPHRTSTSDPRRGIPGVFVPLDPEDFEELYGEEIDGLDDDYDDDSEDLDDEGYDDFDE